jgi:hypothetical protein
LVRKSGSTAAWLQQKGAEAEIGQEVARRSRAGPNGFPEVCKIEQFPLSSLVDHHRYHSWQSSVSIVPNMSLTKENSGAITYQTPEACDETLLAPSAAEHYSPVFLCLRHFGYGCS